MKRPDSLGAPEYQELQCLCDDLASERGVKLVFLAYPNGQMLLASGAVQGVDLTGFAALAAASLASANALGQLMQENQLNTLVFAGEREQLLVYGFRQVGTLVVHFEQTQTLGWMRFQVRKRAALIEAHLGSLMAKYAQMRSPLADASDDEIDALRFGGL